jgi:DNA-directed RNA polymerase specialized sigma24 family protein
MDAGGDFATYVEARGQRLVRSAVLLGCSIPDAEDVAQTALMRCVRD